MLSVELGHEKDNLSELEPLLKCSHGPVDCLTLNIIRIVPSNPSRDWF